MGNRNAIQAPNQALERQYDEEFQRRAEEVPAEVFDEEIAALNVEFAAQRIGIHVATERDRVERNFIDAVNAVFKCILELGTPFLTFMAMKTDIGDGIPLSSRTINQCKEASVTASEKLAVLNDCARNTLVQEEDDNANAGKCLEAAREILKINHNLQSGLKSYQQLLMEEISDELKTIVVTRIDRILELYRQLQAQSSHLEVRPRNYARNQYVQNVENVANRVSARNVTEPPENNQNQQVLEIGVIPRE